MLSEVQESVSRETEACGCPQESGEDLFPLLPAPVSVRLRYRKTGTLQYISHLDLQRTFGRVLARAGIPVWFTKGFNPHPKLTFGLPLSVGTESECEYLDLRIDRDMPPQEIQRRLNLCLTDEMKILDVYLPERKLSEVAFARYEIDLHSKAIGEDFADEATAYLTTSPVMITRRGKAGDRTEDMIPLIRSVSVTCTAGDAHLTLVLSAGTGALNPEFVVTALKGRFGILSSDPLCEWYRILRKQLYLADGVTEFR